MKIRLIPLLAAVVLAACNHSDNLSRQAASQDASQTAAPVPAETILAGSQLDFAPFAFKGPNGQPTGFEIELLEAIADAEGFKVQFLHSPRNQFSEVLENQKFRIIASALAVNTDRASKVDFSHPILDYDREIAFLDIPQNAALQSVNDFKGKKLSASRSFNTAAEITGSAANVTKTETFYLALKMMHAGQTDGVLADSRALAYFDQLHPDIKIRTISLGEKSREIAFAVKKGDTEMLERINRGLKTVKSNGTYQNLLHKWFGNTAK